MNQTFFINNRRRVTEEVEKPIVLTAYTAQQLTGDAAAPFRQESSFWYLTGISEPDWQLIIDSKQHKSWLVIPSVSEIHRVFDGGLSADEAQKISGVDDVIDRNGATSLLKKLSEENESVYSLGLDPHKEYYSFIENPQPERLRKLLEKQFKKVYDIRPIIAKIRAIKQPEEIAAIRSAIELTEGAFSAVKNRLADFRYEYEVEAEFTYAFRRKNAIHAYDPIVAGGKNACTLHYQDNAAPLEDKSLLLVDIGALVDGYPADITRTYAIGEPTDRQKAVYGVVSAAHQKIIALIRPGFALREYQNQVDVIMKEALTTLDLLKTDTDYRRYFPHAISHGLGVDVHDSLGGHETFRPGMVLTVEPGIYIPEGLIGVRLEDDILVTSDGHENLSGNLPLNL